VFKILEFARNFELIAFNEGIKLGKEKVRLGYESMVERLQNNITLAREENIRLATSLEKFIVSEV